MFLKRPDGKELEVVVIKKVRQESKSDIGAAPGAKNQQEGSIVMEASALAQSEVHRVTPRLLANSEMS
jgi:hypothetical protein